MKIPSKMQRSRVFGEIGPIFQILVLPPSGRAGAPIGGRLMADAIHFEGVEVDLTSHAEVPCGPRRSYGWLPVWDGFTERRWFKLIQFS